MVHSSAVNEAKGNPGRHKSRKRRIVDNAPSSNGAPKQLAGAALEVWNLSAPDLRQLNFLRDTDMYAFARYCEHTAEWWRLTQEMQRLGGAIYTTDSNNVKMVRLRPEFIQRDRIERHLVELEDRFGMNPACRQQILLRMSNQMPLPLDNPNGTNQPNDNPSNPIEPELPSAVGFMRQGSDALN